MWLWGLPPTGAAGLCVTWPTGRLPAARVEIDADLVLEAADRAVRVWPTGEEGEP
jgi:hypothetical protein